MFLAAVDGGAVCAGVQPEPAQQPHDQVPREATHQDLSQSWQVGENTRQKVSCYVSQRYLTSQFLTSTDKNSFISVLDITSFVMSPASNGLKRVNKYH